MKQGGYEARARFTVGRVTNVRVMPGARRYTPASGAEVRVDVVNGELPAASSCVEL